MRHVARIAIGIVLLALVSMAAVVPLDAAKGETMYATEQDCIDRYSEDLLLVVADRDGDGMIETAVLDRALADATSEIDAYLGARYELPLASHPEVLKRLAVDMAIYRLCSEADHLTDERRTRYEDALRLLRGIAKGELTLGLPDPEPTTVHAVRTRGPERRFTRDSMRGLRI